MLHVTWWSKSGHCRISINRPCSPPSVYSTESPTTCICHVDVVTVWPAAAPCMLYAEAPQALTCTRSVGVASLRQT